MNEETLFNQALQLPASVRVAFLERECPDSVLRARVEALLAADALSRSPLEPTGAFGEDPNRTGKFGEESDNNNNNDPPMPSKEAAGAIIAEKYTLVELIGEGGMGSVWRAKQTEPVKRLVAVKLIKAGMDSKQVLARFEAERQALALMDHPNIAKVLDGGLHEHRPFFVMELVKGTPITEFCDANTLTVPQRLELFVQACQAIQHAHQKGIIHRDIKPSNVLVALYDDRPMVKVIDFGVAKATGGTLTEQTIDTGFGGVVGTPQYMSPEQATFNNLDIDTRSDMYALGVLLYELLAGSPPFARKDLEKRGLLEILRVVREVEPPRPSTKLSTADALPSISANRATEPKKLTGLLRNELDWIVMKALEKDRTRRYDTANGFAADVQRYLAGEAVLAHPPSTAYRLKKFVKRNKGQVLAASVIALSLVVGIVGTTWQAIRAERARQAESEQRQVAEQNEREANDARQAESEQRRIAQDRERQANNARRDAEAAADAERKAKELAQRNLNYAIQSNDLLGNVFTRLNPLEKKYETADELYAAMRAELVVAVQEFDKAEIEDPLVKARLQYLLGQALRGTGGARFEQYFRLLEASRNTRLALLGGDHPDTLRSNAALGIATLVNSTRKDSDRGEALLLATLPKMKTIIGWQDPMTWRTQFALALNYSRPFNLSNDHDKLKSLSLFRELREGIIAFKQSKSNEDRKIYYAVTQNIVLRYMELGRFDEALKELNDLKFNFSIPGVHPLNDNWLNTSFSEVYRALNNPRQQLDYSLAAYRAASQKLESEANRTRRRSIDLAENYLALGLVDRAEPLLPSASQFEKEARVLDHDYRLAPLGLLLLWHGDYARYAAIRKALQANLGSNQLFEVQLYSIRVACLQSGDVKQMTRFLESAKWMKQHRGPDSILTDYQVAIGMAEYRSGLYSDCDKTMSLILNNKKAVVRNQIPAQFYRAMALFQLGKKAEAIELANAATRAMRPLPRDPKVPIADGATSEDVEVWLTYKEAKALIGFDAEPREMLPPPRVVK